jgi:Fe-Mn family superoxide dismutase
MTYTAKDYSHLLGLTGFSDTLLTNHFTLYQGYVNNVNTLLGKMNTIREARLAGDETQKEESAELHRRYGWEYNGMRLHELYFGNLTKTSGYDESAPIATAITERFGSYENFKTHFTKNVGMFRGIGWVALVKRDDTLGVIWIGEHDEGLLADAKILLIMDVFEHAFLTDYGLKRADYIQSFWNVIDWSVVNNRYTQA